MQNLPLFMWVCGFVTGVGIGILIATVMAENRRVK